MSPPMSNAVPGLEGWVQNHATAASDLPGLVIAGPGKVAYYYPLQVTIAQRQGEEQGLDELLPLNATWLATRCRIYLAWRHGSGSSRRPF